jgi:hypothetical protein
MQTDSIRTLTDKQLERAYMRLWDHLEDGNGYQPFGYDLPTIRAAFPAIYNSMSRLWDEARRRKSQ